MVTFGFGLPTRGPLARPDSIARLAAKAEELGFGHVSVSDHIIIPNSIEWKYPYSDTGEPPFPADGECLEQLTLMSWLAAMTRTVRILSSVMVVPHRNAVHTAKTIATIDVLSGGRVTIGCGAGWMVEEFEAIGTPPFKERGAVTDEYLRAFKELWTSDDPRMDGRYVKFADVKFAPRPVQTPHPPLWIGGESRAALRRVAELGDAWFPIGANPAFPLNTPEKYAARLSMLKQVAARYGRDPAGIDLGFWANWFYTEDRRTREGERHIMSGGAGPVLEDIARLRDLGVRTFMFQLAGGDDESASIDRMDRFADSVMAKAG